MSDESTGVVEPGIEQQRVVGRVIGGEPGPTMIVMTSIHGNEPAGGLSARRLLERLDGSSIRGDLAVLSGNLPALARRTRYIGDDLNRNWTPERLAAGAGRDGHASPEDGERQALLVAFREIVSAARGPVFFLDLHTSSADGAPFLTVGDTLRNRRFALEFPLPVMLGLEEQVDGSLLEFLNNFGFITMGVEAGQHDAPSSVDRMEAILWLALRHAGLLTDEALPDRANYEALLRDASHEIPSVLEVRYRHAITPEQAFRMQPGYTNFQRIDKGEPLATDRNGEIVSPEQGRILLPLYQGKGDDGFFVAREFSFFWLRLSRLVRTLGLSGWLRFLPGVRRCPGGPDRLEVDTHVARIYPLEVFHLFGYRKLRQEGATLVVSRRRYDLVPPARLQL